MKNILSNPLFYHTYQVTGGFFKSRKIIIDEILSKNKHIKNIIDIGCGPGHISTIFNENINYSGFDTNKIYIDYANKNFSKYGNFYCKQFDESSLKNINKVDLIMFNGLLHHIDDNYAKQLLNTAKQALTLDGMILTLDGVYIKNQSKLIKYLLDNDRGNFIRTEEQYRLLISSVFGEITVALRENISRIPYSFIVMTGKNK